MRKHIKRPSNLKDSGRDSLRIFFCTPASGQHEDYISMDLLGIESQTFWLARELAIRGHECTILRRWNTERSRCETIEGVRILSIAVPTLLDYPMRLAVTKLFYSAVASRTIAEHHPDILVMTDPFASLFISHLPIQKLIVTHNPPFGLAYGSSFAARILRDWVYSHVLKRCSAVVAINSRTRALLNEMGYTTEYIPNAINPDNYPAFNDGMPFILAAGRLERVKGLNTLLDAYSRLPGKLRGEFGLRIVGYGPEEKRLRESAARLGIAPTVDFVSWMNHSEFVNTLRQCTVFVLPSVSESMPVTLLEAMACSRPVIASDIHGTSDIVRNEINGLRFLEGSSEMLSTQISRLLESPSLRCRLGTEARTTVVKEFSFVAIAGSYERLFERLVSQSNK